MNTISGEEVTQLQWQSERIKFGVWVGARPQVSCVNYWNNIKTQLLQLLYF